MSTSVIQKYVDTYEEAMHKGMEMFKGAPAVPNSFNLWVTEAEYDYLKKLEVVALQAIERKLISMVRWHRSQGFHEKLELSTRLLAQHRGGRYHAYNMAKAFISLSNV